MVQKYIFAFAENDKILLAIALILALIPTYTLLMGKFHPVILIFPFLSFLAVLLVYLKVGKTAIEISENGLRFHFMLQFINFTIFAVKVPSFLRWDEIQGMIVSEVSVGERKSKIAKIFFKDTPKGIKCLLLESKLFKKSNELFDNLRNKIPDITNEHEVFSGIFQNLVLPSEIQYKYWTLTQEGIVHSKEVIPWNSLKHIHYDDFASGVINVEYQKESTHSEKIKINPSGVLYLKGIKLFRTFLRYLIKNANKASVDPSLLKLFDNKYRREKLLLTSFLILIGFFFIYILIGVVAS